MVRTTRAEPVLISSWPRDDVPLPLPGDPIGEAQVRLSGAWQHPEGPILTLRLGDLRVESLPLALGEEFEVLVSAEYDAGGTREHVEQVMRFRTTGSETDVGHHVVGPGLQVERPRWGRRTVSGFEFGVLVMHAVRIEGP